MTDTITGRARPDGPERRLETAQQRWDRMPVIRSGDDYVASLRDRGTTLYLRGERIDEPADPRWNGEQFEGHGGSRVFYPGLGSWNNDDFQDEWKNVDERGRIQVAPS